MTRKVPTEIEQVATAWRANAREADMPDDACYVSFNENEARCVKVFYVCNDGAPDYRYEEIIGPAWEVTCNYERGPLLF